MPLNCVAEACHSSLSKLAIEANDVWLSLRIVPSAICLQVLSPLHLRVCSQYPYNFRNPSSTTQNSKNRQATECEEICGNKLCRLFGLRCRFRKAWAYCLRASCCKRNQDLSVCFDTQGMGFPTLSHVAHSLCYLCVVWPSSSLSEWVGGGLGRVRGGMGLN